jgi:SAM-dependent methyltransferase
VRHVPELLLGSGEGRVEGIDVRIVFPLDQADGLGERLVRQVGAVVTLVTRALVTGMKPSGPTDPIEHYRRPFIGWLFRERINIGLRLLDSHKRYRRALDVGYGSGVTLLALSSVVDELYGADTDADPRAMYRFLDDRGVKARLHRDDARDLHYDSGTFDLVVSFSTFEHIADYPAALREVARVLQPGGEFLLGMPAVSRVMELAFRAIGVRDIDDHHVTTPAQVAEAFAGAGLAIVDRATLGPLYTTWLLRSA